MANERKGLYEFGPFRLDPSQRLLFRENQPIPLQPKAFETLLVLVRNSEKVVLKDELLNAVWADTFVEESNLTQNIFVLRKALGEADGKRRYIITVPGRGYRLTETARFIPQDDEVVLHSVTRISLEDEPETRKEKEPAAVPELQPVPAPGPALTRRRWSRPLLLVSILAAAVAAVFLVRAFFAPQPMPKVVRSVQLTHTGRAEPLGPVLTDGSRLYFAERIGGTRTLAQVPEQGGEPVQIPTSIARIEVLDIDRLGSRLLAGAQQTDGDDLGSLWVVPTSGGSARRVGDAVGGDAVWSPDAQSIAYARDGDLFIVGDDGSHPRKLFSTNGILEYPRWSPDSHRISFTVRDSSEARSLWEILADGRDPHPLNLGWKTRHAHWGDGECCGDWSPDGRFFIFRSIADNGVASLWAIGQDGGWFRRGRTAPVQLYTSPSVMGPPRFSADGRKIFFVDYRQRRELVRYDSARKTFVPYLTGIPARHLSFSRDGQWVAYKNEEDSGLWRSRRDGTEALRLTFPPLEVLHSTWSPDGKRIAFEANGGVYAVSREGGKPERLLPEDVTSGQPSWSPNSNSLLFTRWTSPSRQSSICVLDLDSHKIEELPESVSLEGSQWSPDGKYAAASSRKDHALMLYDFAEKKWTKLADGTPYGWGIRWSADARYVYYQHIYGGEEQPIFRVRISDHKVEQIASSQQILRADVLSFSMTGLTPDGSPLASFSHRNANILALELELP